MHDIIIEPGQSKSRYWRDIWSYRELFYFLAWRDILVRYKQTVLGVAWALIQPLVTMLILTIVFGRLAKLPSAGVPYPILVLSALLPWQLFSQAVSNAGNSLVGNASLIGKLYFPRLIVPASAVMTSVVDLGISAVLLGLLMIVFQYHPNWQIVALPLFVLLAIAVSMGLGLWIAALTVRYRDFRYIVPFMMQAGLYISPVGFSSSIVPSKWRLLYSLNPMVGVIDGFRWSLTGRNVELYLPGILLGVLVTVVLCGFAIRYFRSTERTFADTI